MLENKLNMPPLVAEANYYYDLEKCGIGYHGDAERRIVVTYENLYKNI